MKTNPLINLCNLLVATGAMLIAVCASAQNTTNSGASSMPEASPLPQLSATPAASTPNVQLNLDPGQQAPAPASPSIVVPPPAAPAQPAAVVPAATVPAQPAIVAPAAPAATAIAPAGPPPATTLPPDVALVPKNEIRMNFQGAQLTDVLNYLSSAAGFVIVQETPVTGTVNIVSKQPVDADTAVKILNSVLVSKGYVAIQDGRILKIVSRTGVATRADVQVKVTSDPKSIIPDDQIVTQIMPVKYVDATKLVDNLRPLLAADASISVNAGSNAILLTDTQANIHRMALIVQALDTSVSSISTIKVYPLRYADAKDFANVLTQLFTTDTSANGQGAGGPGAFFRQFRGGGGGGGGFGGGGGGGEDSGGTADSEARKAATKVVAVADTQSNSVVVSAPDEYIPRIDEIVEKLDTSTTDVTQTRIFQLINADSTTVSNELTMLYGDPTSLQTGNNRNGQNGRGGATQNRGGGNNPFGQPQQAATTQPSNRELMQAKMVAVPDPRTNSVLVNCSADTMVEVAQTIGRLDASNAKKQEVYTIALEHADPDNVAPILRVMFHDTTSPSGTASALQTYKSTGVDSSITGALGTGNSSGGGGGIGNR